MSTSRKLDIDTVLALEQQRCTALVAGDMAVLDALTADDYTHVESSGGVRDKAGFLAAMGRTDQRFVEWVIVENSVRVYGDVAVATGCYHNTLQTAAGVQPTKHARHQRVWVRRDGSWRNVAHQATALAVPPPATDQPR